MATILVVDDMAIFRDPLAAMLRLAGHSTLIAMNGHDALKLIDNKQVDLVLLDLAMPVMDGGTFLERLRAHPKKGRIPVILLTAITDRSRIMEVVNRGVQDCLLKSQFSTKELLTRVQRQLEIAQQAHLNDIRRATAKPAVDPAPAALPAAPTAHTPPTDTNAPIPRLLTREQALTRAAKAMEAATLSGVVAQVISLAASPRSDLSSLASMISRDAVLAAKILQAANSAVYASSGGPVFDINDAVKRVGCATVRNIAATLGIYESMPPSPADSDFDFVRCWQHSLAVANLCEQLTAQSKHPDDASVAYLIGLCHDLAQILFHSHFQGEYSQVLNQERSTGKRRDMLERQMLGVTHHDLISLILGRIGLPENISDPIRAFHDTTGTGHAANHQMTKVLKLADAYANGMMLGSQKNFSLTAFTRAECKAAVGTDSPATPAADQFRGEILAQTMMLARLSRSAERELTTPLFRRSTRRVLLTRDPALSEFDPISEFVRSIAEVHVQGQLPSMTEAAGYDSVVVLSRSPSSAAFSLDDLKKLSPLKACFWAVAKDDGTVPTHHPVQPRECPIYAVDLAAFVAGEEITAAKASA